MLIILAPKMMSHVCALLIDNAGNYLYLNNGRFKFEVDPHQFNHRLHHFSQFQRIKKKIQKLAGLWLAGDMVDHIGIYGSKVAEGLSAFQRRSCYGLLHNSRFLQVLKILTIFTNISVQKILRNSGFIHMQVQFTQITTRNQTLWLNGVDPISTVINIIRMALCL